jgi:hypothetical protein
MGKRTRGVGSGWEGWDGWDGMCASEENVSTHNDTQIQTPQKEGQKKNRPNVPTLEP